MNADEERAWVTYLGRMNPWWRGARLEGVPAFKRRDYFVVEKALRAADNKAVVVTGVRQVGKTTLLRQLILGLLDSGVAPERIMYIDFEGVGVELLSGNPLVEALEAYQKHVLKKDARAGNEEIYVFLDEAHRAGDWARVLKIWVDAASKARFVVSGSSRQELFRASSETLPGRHTMHALVPLKFLETVRLKLFTKNPADPRLEKLRTISRELREALAAGIQGDSAEVIFTAFQRAGVSLALDQLELEAALADYLLKGGYPAVVRQDDLQECARLLDGYARDILAKDASSAFSVRNVEAMGKLMRYLARISGQKVAWNNALAVVGLADQRTLKAYVGYLAHLLVISLAEFYSPSPEAGMRKNPKIYVNDPGLRNFLASELVPELAAGNAGRLAETTVFDHCIRLAFNLVGQVPHLSYWENRYEVDVILPVRGKIVPLEVKYSSAVKASELKGMDAFRKQYGSKLGIVVTKNELALRNGIVFIPCWLFLLAA